MHLFKGRVAPTLHNLRRRHSNSSGALSAAENRLIICVLLTVGLALALSGCGSTVKPQVVGQPPAQPTAAVVPTGPTALLVDHAWVKNASSSDEQAEQHKIMETLRAKVVAGGSFIASWESFGVDGTLWHVAEQESYAADVVPEGARDLPVGTISPILPGHGGLHLFRILGREPLTE